MAYALREQDNIADMQSHMDTAMMNRLATHLIKRATVLKQDITFEVSGVPHKALADFSEKLEAVGVSYAASRELIEQLRRYWVSRGESFARAVNATPIWIKFAVSKDMPEKVFDQGMADTTAFTGFEQIGDDFATTIHRHLTFGGESMTSNNDALRVFDKINGQQMALWLHTESPSRSDLQGLETLRQTVDAAIAVNPMAPNIDMDAVVENILQSAGKEGLPIEVKQAIEISAAPKEKGQVLTNVIETISQHIPQRNEQITVSDVRVDNAVGKPATTVDNTTMSGSAIDQLQAVVQSVEKMAVEPNPANVSAAPVNLNVAESVVTSSEPTSNVAMTKETPREASPTKVVESIQSTEGVSSLAPIKQQLERIVATVETSHHDAPISPQKINIPNKTIDAIREAPIEVRQAVIKAAAPLQEIIEKIDRKESIERPELIEKMVAFDQAMSDIPQTPIKAELREIAAVTSQALIQTQQTPEISREAPAVEMQTETVRPVEVETVAVRPLKPEFEVVNKVAMGFTVNDNKTEISHAPVTVNQQISTATPETHVVQTATSPVNAAQMPQNTVVESMAMTTNTPVVIKQFANPAQPVQLVEKPFNPVPDSLQPNPFEKPKPMGGGMNVGGCAPGGCPACGKCFAQAVTAQQKQDNYAALDKKMAMALKQG